MVGGPPPDAGGAATLSVGAAAGGSGAGRAGGAPLAGLVVAWFAAVFERVFMRRVYGTDVLMQLLVCYAFILILDDVVKIVWGPEFQSMGMPAAFQAPPILFGGGVIPVFYLFLISAAAVIALGLWFLLVRTRIASTGPRCIFAPSTCELKVMPSSLILSSSL